MSGLLKTMLMIPSGGVGKLEYRKSANIFSDYNLCSSLPFEELTVSLESAYNLCIPGKEYLTASPISVYDLSTEET